MCIINYSSLQFHYTHCTQIYGLQNVREEHTPNQCVRARNRTNRSYKYLIIANCTPVVERKVPFWDCNLLHVMCVCPFIWYQTQTLRHCTGLDSPSETADRAAASGHLRRQRWDTARFELHIPLPVPIKYRCVSVILLLQAIVAYRLFLYCRSSVTQTGMTSVLNR